ncbi:MAG: preprotein translocase subunit YajC [Acidobacteriota bacterium]
MAPAQGEQGNLFISLIPIILIFVVFYFLLIAPARKKQKKLQEMIKNLKNGDRVVTSGGIYGTVVGISDQIIQLRIADKIKIDVAKNAIVGLVSHEEATES